MAKYRITEITYYPSTTREYKKYLVQKRLLGFLWWYDPFDDGMYSDGYCSTYEEALDLVERHLGYKKIRKTVWTNE